MSEAIQNTQTTAGSYFERTGPDSYQPTSHAGGAWSPGEIHFSPLGGLIVHALDAHRAAHGGDSKVLARISFDILGFLAANECAVEVETLRPGRTIELLQATVTIDGRPAVIGRAWYLSELDTSAVAGGASERMPDPDDIETANLTGTWSGGYVASVEFRPTREPEPGRAAIWVRSPVTIVEREESSPHADFVAQVDVANGIAVRSSPTEWMFPNVDLTIHFFRQPRGEWIGLDTTVAFGPTGQGLTSTQLHDVEGHIGTAAQILTVRPLAPATDAG